MTVCRILLCWLVVLACGQFSSPLLGQSDNSQAPLWIWSPDQPQERVPQGACHFRKLIYLPKPVAGKIEVAGDDAFDVFVNGKLVGSGSSWESLTHFDITDQLRAGKNLVAVKVTNRNGSTAGLAARITVDVGQDQPRVYLTNPTWKTNINVLPLWNRPRYRDARWNAAQNLGRYGEAEPWLVNQETEIPAAGAAKADVASQADVSTRPAADDRKSGGAEPRAEQVAQPTPPPATASEGAAAPEESPAPKVEFPRFKVPPDFRIEHIAGGEDTGSLIALAFNEFGQLLVSREGGGLLMVYDSNDNDIPDSVRVCCEKVSNCQGIVSVSGRIFVIGDGPQEVALYRLEDHNHDGDFETVNAIARFEGNSREHGPHGLVLGPDGMLYVALGNHTKLKSPISLTSPHRNYYEGDLATSRYEDPRGHAAGIKAPGGGVLRIDQEGRVVELFAGGLRNAYDLAFNRDGELFTHDSDMESDEGTPWHRPTRLLHVVPGAEFGWRSGWAKWPDYWVDSLPPILNTGRGSPTGLVFYDHTALPPPYRGALFSCDWALGQIAVIQMRRSGAGYIAQREIFLQGKPLNVTDIDVGPDGWLYFSTGGRGTVGNIFRVVHESLPPEAESSDPSDIVRAVTQPQLNSAWARQAVSTMRRDLGTRWDKQIRALAHNTQAAGPDRTRAMELMHLVGPPPSDEQLVELSEDDNAAVRTKAAFYMGLIGNELTSERLVQMLSDTDPVVRRHSCEALARQAKSIPLEFLADLVASPDRTESWSARRLLEWNEDRDWHGTILTTDNQRLFIQGATAMLIAEPSPERAVKIVERVGEHAARFVNDADFVDMLRLVQLSMIRGNVRAEEIPDTVAWLTEEFPAGNVRINHELASLLTYLEAPNISQPMVAMLSTDMPEVEKIHLATRLAALQSGWRSEDKLLLLAYLDQARNLEGGRNLARYMDRITRDFAKSLDASDHEAILSQGELFPDAALATLFAMPEKVDAATVGQLEELYRRIGNEQGKSHNQLRIGIIAVMGSSGLPPAMAALRDIYDRDPERRQAAAMALAQQPAGRNWDYLVKSIPLLEGDPAREVLAKLHTVRFAPDSPEYLRQVIIAGLRLGDEGGLEAASLLSHWTGRPAPETGDPWDTVMAEWQRWFDQKYPDQPVASVPKAKENDTWTFDDLVTYLESQAGSKGSAERGAAVYRQAQCANCHRFQNVGETFGPDLTAVANRFQKREILESITHPSQVISDQYASNTVGMSDGRTITGLLMPGQNGTVVIMQPSGSPVTVVETDIEELAPSKVSSMPEGLLNELSLQEIADLFAYLTDTTPAEMADVPDDSRR